MLKIGGIFRAGKATTGCNMEGIGAGAAVTAAVLTELRGGSPTQVGKALVLALSPTIAVPCTPRVMVPGLCALHISAAILIGNQAANLVLKTSLPMPVDVDAMVAMAARIHREAAPAITPINIRYLRPFFERDENVEKLVSPDVLAKEAAEKEEVLRASEGGGAQPRGPVAFHQAPLGDVVFGGSSMAVGSPTNMGRICHELAGGQEAVAHPHRADLRPLFAQGDKCPRHTDGRSLRMRPRTISKATAKSSPTSLSRKMPIELVEVKEPEVQRIRIETAKGSAMVDSRNRGGGRLAIVDAEPSREAAIEAAGRLGIVVAP